MAVDPLSGARLPEPADARRRREVGGDTVEQLMQQLQEQLQERERLRLMMMRSQQFPGTMQSPFAPTFSPLPSPRPEQAANPFLDILRFLFQ